MFKQQLLVLMLVAGMIFTGAFAQEPPAESQPGATGPAGPDPNQPKAESVLKHIPADCLGFFVVSNVKDLLSQSEKFASQIGLGELLGIFPLSTVENPSSQSCKANWCPTGNHLAPPGNFNY